MTTKRRIATAYADRGQPRADMTKGGASAPPFAPGTAVATGQGAWWVTSSGVAGQTGTKSG